MTYHLAIAKDFLELAIKNAETAQKYMHWFDVKGNEYTVNARYAVGMSEAIDTLKRVLVLIENEKGETP